MAGLDLAQLQGNRNAWILMAHPLIGTFKGIVQDEFVVGGSAEYSNPFQAHLEDVNAIWQAAGSAVTNFTGVEIPIPNLKSQLQSLHQYISSERPTFQLQMTFIRFDLAQRSITDMTKKLVASTFPRGGDRNNMNATLENPGSYNAASVDRRPENTWTMEIGEYFRADQLVLRNATATHSKEVVRDGTPLYAQVAVAFEPAMIPTEADVLSWFLK